MQLKPHYLLLLLVHFCTGVYVENLKVNHGKFLPPAFMEGIMDLVGLAVAVYEARGTASYEDMRKELPAQYQDSYHKVIQVKVIIDCDFLISRHDNWCKYSGTITELCVPDHWAPAAINVKLANGRPFPDLFLNFSGLLVLLSIYIDKKCQNGRKPSKII